MKGSRQFRAVISDLDQMMKYVRDFLDVTCDVSKSKNFEIAIEEALVNVIHYAYLEYPQGPVEIEYSKEVDQLVVIIKDRGAPFNPLENPKPFNKDAPIEEREIGGLGIHFILKMADRASYERNDGSNILTLVKLV
jgi:anti-sigma regulatory factor (Ser/Thr protein kinase)